ncbi:MAG: hypothetical protein V4664_00595 [Patescibacteria group bacterium]
MNATLKKYLALQTEFFATLNGKVMPHLLPDYPNPRGEHYSVTMHTCIECYLEEGWPQKLGELLLRHNIDLDTFVAATKEKHMGFRVQDGKLQNRQSRCPKIHEVLEVIADLMPE